MFKRFHEFSPDLQNDIVDYVDDTAANWLPDKAVFELRAVPIKDLEKAEWRILPSLKVVDMNMAGQSQTPEEPLVLDADFSVIDGMHRLATAIRDNQIVLRAWVRVKNERLV